MNSDAFKFAHGNCAFQIECLEATVSILDERLDQAIGFLLQPDIGYGLSPIGVVQLLNLLRGEHDDIRAPRFLDGEA